MILTFRKNISVENLCCIIMIHNLFYKKHNIYTSQSFVPRTFAYIKNMNERKFEK